MPQLCIQNVLKSLFLTLPFVYDRHIKCLPIKYVTTLQSRFIICDCFLETVKKLTFYAAGTARGRLNIFKRTANRKSCIQSKCMLRERKKNTFVSYHSTYSQFICFRIILMPAIQLSVRRLRQGGSGQGFGQV